MATRIADIGETAKPVWRERMHTALDRLNTLSNMPNRVIVLADDATATISAMGSAVPVALQHYIIQMTDGPLTALNAAVMTRDACHIVHDYRHGLRRKVAAELGGLTTTAAILAILHMHGSSLTTSSATGVAAGKAMEEFLKDALSAETEADGVTPRLRLHGPQSLDMLIKATTGEGYVNHIASEKSLAEVSPAR